jgi:hypothetical protein
MRKYHCYYKILIRETVFVLNTSSIKIALVADGHFAEFVS